MLLPEQVLPFLQHDDPIVRGHARRYFRNCYDFGPLTAEHYWAAIDRLGENDDTLGFASALSDLPQTDASLRRLLKGLAAETSEDFEFHYQHVARDMELAVLARNRAELLACPQLLPHVRSHLELRLNLLEESPASAWDRLMQRGRELGGTNAYKFDYSPSDALIEAAARGGAPICELAMNTLADESAAEDWREIFAVQVLGAARYEPAIDALVEKLGIDADVLREDTNRALARIGTSKVVQRLVAFYPGKPWHVRLYTHTPLAHIKRPESCDALLNLLDVELALAADANLDEEGPPLIDTLLLDLTELGSLAGLDQSRRLIGEYPDDPETLDLYQCLIATAVMTGRTLPEESTWRKRLKAREARLSACGDLDGMFRGFRDNWRKTGISIAPSVHTDIEKDNEAWKSGTAAMGDYVEPVKPIRNEGPKIGRNDPCPCGSGKKYKKCCRK